MSGLYETGKVNTDSILSAVHCMLEWRIFLCPEDLKIPIHCTAADCDTLYYTYDIDGLVVQVKELCGVVGCVHYPLLPELQVHMISDHFEILKKHVRLSRYRERQTSALRNCSG